MVIDHIIPTLHPAFAIRRRYRNASPHQALWLILDDVDDPELPGVSIWDLGVLQDVQLENQQVNVKIMPTYSGCPAVDTIKADILTQLTGAGFMQVEVKVVLTPAWHTDMISPKGKQQLQALSIVPPSKDGALFCPICGSVDVDVMTPFGATACKGICRCNACKEVFDYFKQLS